MSIELKDVVMLVRELQGESLLREGMSHSFEIGKCYLIRTVTMYYTGRVKAITDTDIVLSDTAWIADTGRFSDALRTGDFNEVEPFVNDVIISRGCITDATLWDHDLPRAQK